MEKFLDERLELFPLVKTIEDPGRRSRAYVAVRDAGTEQELTRYGDYLRTIGGDLAKQMDLDAFREKADGIVGRIPDMTTRLKAVKAVAGRATLPRSASWSTGPRRYSRNRTTPQGCSKGKNSSRLWASCSDETQSV